MGIIHRKWRKTAKIYLKLSKKRIMSLGARLLESALQLKRIRYVTLLMYSVFKNKQQKITDVEFEPTPMSSMPQTCLLDHSAIKVILCDIISAIGPPHCTQGFNTYSPYFFLYLYLLPIL